MIKQPQKRLGYGSNDAKDIKNHEFFKDINWKDLNNLNVKPPFKPKIDHRLDLRHFDKVIIKYISIYILINFLGIHQ